MLVSLGSTVSFNVYNVFRNYFAFSFMFFILVPYTISLGSCNNFSFSICWMAKDDTFERSGGNIWLNTTALKSIRTQGKFTSLTVSPTVENKLTLQYGGTVQKWKFTISPSTNSIEIRGLHKPQDKPSKATQETLGLLTPTEVFACENGTLFFHQDENLILTIGHTLRLPVSLESRSPAMLLVSWMENLLAAPDPSAGHSVSLYYDELGSYTILSVDTTTRNHYRFTALESCSHYAACVEMAGTHSLTCLSTITDPDIPQHFLVSSWNSTGITVAWQCPGNRKFSLFLLTAFYLNGTDHVTEETPFWHQEDRFVFTLSDLAPCTRVKFGLQTVCQAGMDSRYSKMVKIDGNSVHSTIKALRQTSFGPDNYTLTWDVGNTSSISMFRVYHQGALLSSTLVTNHTVGGLLPCRWYLARVEALCGESVLMSAKTVAAHTGPRGVSDLRYRSNDSVVLWSPGTTHRPAVAFLYNLSFKNGTSVRSGHLVAPALRLPGLVDGLNYALHVWEQCDGVWQSEPALVCFDGVSRPIRPRTLPVGHDDDDDIELQLGVSSPGLAMVVPWLLSGPLQDPMSEPGAQMEKIIKNKLQELLEGFHRPARVQLVTFEPLGEEGKTQILFKSFDASVTDRDEPLPVAEQLDYIQSLQLPDITLTDRLIHWDGPDVCASSKQTLCPPNSLCINTLGSFTCVCHHGYYDVGSAVTPPVAPHPVCNEKGLFIQCLDKLMAGSIAKAYLVSYFGGKVDVELNDGRCNVDESETLFYFRTSRKASECGTRSLVNNTHIQFQNTLSVTLSKDQTITRRDLKIVWKCVYPRNYIRNAQVNVDLEWITSLSLVEFNSSLELGLTMTLYSDKSYTHSYRNAVALGLEDTLFFQVALQTNNTFVSEVLLQVESCWATESADPQDEVKGLFLQEGCPVDNTFQWRSANGVAQTSRFSIQMFTMPKGLPIYFHCLARICGYDEDCTANCTTHQLPKRSVSKRDINGKRTVVVSAGPLLVSMEAKSGVQPSNWTEHLIMISIVAGSIGFLGITVLGVSATKAIMSYYERLRLQ